MSGSESRLIDVATLEPALVRWVLEAMGADGPPDEVSGLRDGGSPWLIRVGPRGVVLRVGSTAYRDALGTEQTALEFARAGGVPVPAVLVADLERDPPVLLIEQVEGSSTIPGLRPAARLRVLGAAAARLHRIAVPASAGLPYRDRPISGEDFDALRRSQPARPLLQRAERVVADYRPQGPDGFVHGDFWQGNTLWNGDELTGMIDWDCAGRGAAGVDLGSLRCDAAICFGVDSAADVLRGWEDEAGRAAHDVAYWDVVAALSTPPTMDWFVAAIGGQGRSDLDQPTLVGRRDEFLAAALTALGSEGASPNPRS